jgi:hypothetical protein
MHVRALQEEVLSFVKYVSHFASENRYDVAVQFPVRRE